MELRHLRQAVVLADYRSFSKAAVALNLSQSALSRGIQALEERAGAKLFERNHGGVEPTSAGMLLLKRARSLLTQVEELQVEMGRSAGGGERSLRVAAGPYAAPISVIPAIEGLWQGRMEPRIEVDVTRWSRAIRLVRQGRVDFAVAEDSDLDNEGLEVTKLQTHQAYAVVRAGHPLEGSKPLGLEEVFAWPLAFVSGVPARLSSRFPQTSGPSLLAPTFRCEDLGLMRKLVASTDLVALLPLCLIDEELAAGRLKAVPLREAWVKTSFSILRLSGQPLTESLAELIHQVVEADRLAADRNAELARQLGFRVR